MTKKQIIKILRIIMPIVAVMCLIVFPPWELLWVWIKPLPESVQEEVEDAIGNGFDGMVVYVNDQVHTVVNRSCIGGQYAF